MINLDNIFHIYGIVITVLVSISIFTYTNKTFFGNKTKKISTPNYIYDPNYNTNFTEICLFSGKIYQPKLYNATCKNITLVQWYNPWLRHYLWKEYWNEVEMRRKVKAIQMMETEIKTVTENTILNEIPILKTTTEIPQVERNNAKIQKLRDKSEFMYTVLVGCLVISMLGALWEVFKDKMKKNEGIGAKPQDRPCSLADFTINRHLRRESQQQQQQTGSHLPRQASIEKTPKVTQNLIHQSSLDRAFPQINSEVKSIEERRNSVPSYLTTIIPANEKVLGRNITSGSSNLTFRSKRQSIDVTAEEISSDMKKKPRHFIRRH